MLLAPQAAALLRELSVSQQVDGRPNPHGHHSYTCAVPGTEPMIRDAFARAFGGPFA